MSTIATSQPQWSRREFLRLGGAAVAAGALGSVLTACGSSKSGAAAPKTAVPLTFAYQPGYNYGMYYVAQEKGWFEQQGVTLTHMTIFQQGTLEADALLAGQFDAAVLGFVPVLEIAASGEPIRIIDVVDNSGETYALVSQASIPSVPGLKGKSVGVTLGTNYQYFLDQVLQKYGMVQSDVKVVNLQPLTAQSAFAAGRLDAVVPITINTHSILSQRPGSKILFDGSDFTKPPNPSSAPFAIYDLLVTNESTISSHSKELVKLMEVFHTKIPTYVSHNQAQAVDDIYAWQTSVVKAHVTKTQIQVGLSGYQFYDVAQVKQVVVGGELAASLSSIVDYLISIGSLKSRPNLSTLIDTKLVGSLV